MRAGFWRRLAATWVDWFVIYAIAVFVIELTALVHVRIAFEPLFVVAGAVYGTVMLTRWAQTIGKMLLGIALTTKTGVKPSLRNAFVREALGKWGIAFAAPAALGRLLVGQGWVPTVYDLLILPPLLLVLFIHYLIAKRTWYDWLGGTVVERLSGVPARAKPAFVGLMATAVIGLGTQATEYAIQGRLPCRLSLYRSMRSTAPYVAFLRKGRAKPVDYIIGLFDRYDVVVLCERWHPEATQWDFIFDVVRDPRFIDQVGHVFTEYGQVGMQSHLDAFMAADGLSPSEIHDRAVHIMRNVAVWPTWTNTNFYTYLTRLYALNQSLPPAKRIHHHFTDAAVNWAEITTKEQYQAYRRSLENRDEQMAKGVIDEMARLKQSQPKPPKCLVVMNFRHAFDLTGRSPGTRPTNTYEYIRAAFGQRAANVLVGAYWLFVPVAGGVWDAAFAEAGDSIAGFDFIGSPFGEDAFDLFPFIPTVRGRLKYRDVFSGLAYTHPLEMQILQYGIPGYYKGVEGELLRRGRLLGEDTVPLYESEIQRERAGLSSVIRPMSALVNDTQTFPALSLLALNGIGLLIGIIAFGLSLWRHRSRPAV